MSRTRQSVKQDELYNYMNYYMNDPNSKELEYEIRFGTYGNRKINIVQYHNVIQQLKSIGFIFGEQTHALKMQSEFIDQKTGYSRISNIRTEIYGLQNIREFCLSNSITKEDKVKQGIQFLQKSTHKIINEDGSSKTLFPANYNDFNFRLSLARERKLKYGDGLVKQLVNDWNDKKKIYRLVNRISGSHYKYPGIKVDLSVTKSSLKNKKGSMIPFYNVSDSKVFDSVEHYEIEIEYNKELGGFGTNATKALKDVKSTITNILRGLQQTHYPVSYNEIDDVLDQYMRILHPKDKPQRRVYPKDFVGPSSISLEMKNIVPISKDSNIPNIYQPYTVTDKADGLRKLLFVHKNGKIYMIDTNMGVQFTGLKTESIEHVNSILDGEHVLFDKNGMPLDLYASFDIYYINGEDKRDLTFVKRPASEDEEEDDESSNRLDLLSKFISTLKPKSVSETNVLNIEMKSFVYSSGKSDTASIFDACKLIMEKTENGYFRYETDGLIFTPAHTGVSSDKVGEILSPVKRTWYASFKWKPPEYNTVDFLATTMKADNGKDKISSVYESGVSMDTLDSSNQYKTLVLRVGFDEARHGYINPCNDVYEDKLPKADDIDDTEGYKPMPFYPTNPSSNNAYLCNIQLHKIKSNTGEMYVEDKTQVFEDNTIVEFRYDGTKPEGWRWIPIKVRYDKTAELKAGLKNFGNAYHVANSVWQSIHNPISIVMLTTGQNIPKELADDDVYYNFTGRSVTRALRDFHNLYVKRKLVFSTTRPGQTLYDLAVGKGGDFPKWIASKLKFVFGVDISKDNIFNRLDGACARFLNYRKQYSNMPKALFLQANSGADIVSGNACFSEKGKQIVSAVFGKGPKDRRLLGDGVYNAYGIGREGFDVVSCQFALHYFFQNSEMLHHFLKNVSDGCKVGGYFIGTCYDGKKIFNLLKDKKENESHVAYKNGKKIWELVKKYDSDEFENDVTCLGYGISVYQETINKYFMEYLVNFDYLNLMMEQYGFQVLSKEEAAGLKLPSGQGSFEDLYLEMKKQVAREKRKKFKGPSELEIGDSLMLDKSKEERQISFLNNYFVFKKIKDVNSMDIFKLHVGKQVEELKIQQEMEKMIEKSIRSEEAEEAKEDVKESDELKSVAKAVEEAVAKEESDKNKDVKNEIVKGLTKTVDSDALKQTLLKSKGKTKKVLKLGKKLKLKTKKLPQSDE